MRAFVAIDVGALAGDAAGRTGSAPEHMTLAFLGEVAPDRIAPISEALAGVARRARPFELVLDGIGAFPSEREPRVVWVGVTNGAAEVERLARDVADALAGEGDARPPSRFVPHVTRFRVRSDADRHRAIALLAGSVAPPPARTVAVRELLLKASTLGRAGAAHRTLASFPLGPGDAPADQPAGEPMRSATSFLHR